MDLSLIKPTAKEIRDAALLFSKDSPQRAQLLLIALECEDQEDEISN